MIEDGDVPAPYVPRPVIDWIEHHPELRHRVIDGTVVFVDISGFTKLSEELTKHGKIPTRGCCRCATGSTSGWAHV